MTNYPKIGIRPTIDGRRQGVRESLEEQTWKMAESVKKLIEEHLFYPDGTPVSCVLSPSTIGRVKKRQHLTNSLKKKMSVPLSQ